MILQYLIIIPVEFPGEEVLWKGVALGVLSAFLSGTWKCTDKDWVVATWPVAAKKVYFLNASASCFVTRLFGRNPAGCSQLSSQDSLFLKERAGCQIGWDLLSLEDGVGCQSCIPGSSGGTGVHNLLCCCCSPPPELLWIGLDKNGLKSTTWYSCFVCIHGKFP